jgi:3-oxoacyl-[acyl-carrier-protein] synthase-1
MESQSVELSIDGVGAVCSLGVDLPNAAAAWRAGLSRAAPDLAFSVRDTESASGAGVTVHAVPVVAHGFEGLPRFQRLLEAALKDVNRRFQAALHGKRIGCLLVLPHPKRRFLTHPLIDDEEDRAEAQRLLAEVPEIDNAFLNTFVGQAVAASGISVPVAFHGGTAQGPVGFIDALAETARLFGRGACDSMLICCVDSLVDYATLSWLESVHRLKTPDSPVGIEPGESAAVVIVSRSSARSSRLRVSAIAAATETAAFNDGGVSTGVGLNECITACLRARHASPEDRLWFVSDANGESYRAQEWGQVLVRLRESQPSLDEAVTWFPAAGLGEVGAAFPGLALGLIEHAVLRGHAPAAGAVVCFGADQGPRGAYLVKAMETANVGR